MILGVGYDLVEVERIRAALARSATGSRFRSRVFTSDEIAYCERRRNAAESYAARFAAKEATVKALGRSCAWLEVEVVRSDGAPSLVLHGRALAFATAQGISRMHVSLTHTTGLAGAVVIAEG